MKIYYCFNVKSKESFKCNGAKEVYELTGCKTKHISTISSNNTLFKNIWFIIDITKYGNSLGNFKNKYQLPNSYLQPFISKIKSILVTEIYNNIVEKYPDDIKHKAIYIIVNQTIVKELFSYKEVAEFLNISESAVRKRLFNATTLEKAYKYGCIKSKVYQNLIDNET